MPQYILSDIPIQFPYDAYPCQLVFMEKVILALKGQENALLESPTGLFIYCGYHPYYTYLFFLINKKEKIFTEINTTPS
ncbi:hypothetical protein HMI55_004706 [Coelomomyces lativittatus]|nr:hypothetical protein HMI55_004706 [Coelomomyces lativittatus]